MLFADRVYRVKNKAISLTDKVVLMGGDTIKQTVDRIADKSSLTCSNYI